MTEAAQRGEPDLKTLFERSLQKYIDRTAVHFGDRTLTYGELDRRSNAFANALVDRGVIPGHRTALLMVSLPEYLVARLGLIKAGAVELPINPMLSPPEFEYMLSDAGAGTVITGPSFTETIDTELRGSLDKVENWIAITRGENPPAAFESFSCLESEGSSSTSPEVDLSPDDLGGHFYTGGTTGKPKGVLHTQRGLALDNAAHLMEFEIGGDDTLLITTPLPHAGGGFLSVGLLCGADAVVHPSFDVEDVLAAIETHGVTWTFMVPTMIYELLDSPALAEADTSSLDTICYGAAPMTPDRLRAGLEEFGPIFLQFYGQTEIPNLITTLGKDEHRIALDGGFEERLSSAGHPSLMVDLRIQDVETGREVGPGEIGELLASAPYQMVGYHERPDATDETLDDGWVRTGDIARVDEDGYVYLLDRRNDVIVSGGMNVYSTAVEEVIAEHQAVQEVGVIGIPDDKWGEAVKAVVVTYEEASTTEQEIISFSEQQLADYKIPKSVDFVDNLPKTPYGKIDKGDLREPYWQGTDREIG